MTDLLVESAVRSLLCAAVVGLGLTVFRVRNVPARKLAWTLVLLAAICMPGLMLAPLPFALRLNAAWAVPVRGMAASAERWLGPAAPVSAAPAQSSAKSADVLRTKSVRTAPARFAAVPAVDTGLIADPVAAAPAQRSVPPLRQVILWMYVTVAGVLLLRLLIGVVAALRLWISAEPVSPLVAPEPNVRASGKIPAPVTVGSGIVLPAEYASWDRSKLRMVIAHERSHVRQMDFYLQLLAGLYTAVFWFSPLGWWLRRVLCSLGEAIGDRAGMEAAATRSHYAETLLEIAALPQRTLPGVAMARSANLSRRVESMLNERQLHRAFVEGRIRAAASLLVIPVAMLVALAVVRVPAAAAQSAQQPAPPPQTDTQQQKPTTGQSHPPEDQVTKPSPDEQNPAAPASPASPAAPAGQGNTEIPAGQNATPAAPPSPQTPATPASPETPAAPMSADVPAPPPDQSTTSIDDSGYLYGFGSDGDAYAIVTGPNQTMTFSGNWDSEGQAELQKARQAAKEPFLWIRHEGKSYIVTDPAIIAQLQKMYAPMQELGKQQEALGRQQEALGRQQEALGRQQREAGAIRMPDMSKEMADVNAAVARLRNDQTHWNAQKWADLEAKLKADQDKMLTPEKMAEIQEKLAEFQAEWNSERMAEFEARMAEMQAKLGSLEGEAGARMGAFGSQMGELGRQQGELGRQQGKLGAQQGRLARQLNREVQKIIQDSLANGKAKPLQ